MVLSGSTPGKRTHPWTHPCTHPWAGGAQGGTIGNRTHPWTGGAQGGTIGAKGAKPGRPASPACIRACIRGAAARTDGATRAAKSLDRGLHFTPTTTRPVFAWVRVNRSECQQFTPATGLYLTPTTTRPVLGESPIRVSEYNRTPYCLPITARWHLYYQTRACVTN